MTIQRIQYILDQHHVPHRMENGRLLADHMYVLPEGVEMPWVDMTDCRLATLMAWLGY